MRLRFLSAVILLILACWVQFWFAAIGAYIDVILASLIVFAFFFDIWEMLTLVVFAVLLVNWQPSITMEIVLFAMLPLAVYASHRFFAWQAWIAAPIAIIIALIVFYCTIAPSLFFSHFLVFSEDVFGSLVFGGLIFLALSRLKNKTL